jgi:hypothetical protein
MEYYGLFNITLGRWVFDGNSLIHYPVKEIAEAHLLMMGKEHHFEVRAFNRQQAFDNKKKNK